MSVVSGVEAPLLASQTAKIVSLYANQKEFNDTDFNFL